MTSWLFRVVYAGVVGVTLSEGFSSLFVTWLWFILWHVSQWWHREWYPVGLLNLLK